MTIKIETSRHIRTSYDMVPITVWLDENVINNKWKWVVSDEWIPEWGHPMIIEFEKPIDNEFLLLFRLMWG